jgi:hypothetical protein
MVGLLTNLGVFLLLRRQGRKLSAETTLASATAAEKLQKLASEQVTELEILRERVAELEGLLEDERQTVDRLEADLAILREEVRLLRGC